MYVTGILCTEEEFDAKKNLQLCAYFVGKGGVKYIGVRLYGSYPPKDIMMVYCGIIQRTSEVDSTPILVATSYSILPLSEIPDGMPLVCNITIHGNIAEDNTIVCDVWHNEQKKVFGNFKTKLEISSKRKSPDFAKALLVSGNVIDYVDNNFVVKALHFDHCIKRDKKNDASDGSPSKKKKFAALTNQE